MAADDVNDVVLDYVLSMKQFELIENFLIDLQIIKDFLPDIFKADNMFKAISFLIGAFELI